MAKRKLPEPVGDVLLYQTEDGKTRIEVRVEAETVWLSQAQMAELFQTTKQNVSLHIQNIYREGELQPSATVKESLTVQREGLHEPDSVVKKIFTTAGRKNYRMVHYNLDVKAAMVTHAENELDPEATIRKFRIVRLEGSRL